MLASKETARNYSMLTLAFYGDSVYEELVRRKLIEKGSVKSEKLHKEAVEKVCASYQSMAFGLLEPILTGEEADILRRARNVTGLNIPRSSSPRDYHRATALEALFGYLRLIGDEERILTLFEVCFNGAEKTDQGKGTDRTVDN